MTGPNGCTKTGYVSRREANHWLKLITTKSNRSRKGMGGLRVYRCDRCQLWHLGRKRKGEGQGFKEKGGPRKSG